MQSRLRQLGRLWRTVRWLKPGQVLARLRFRLHRPTPDLRPAPPARAVTGAWVTPAQREASLLGATQMSFLGDQHDLNAVGWDHPALPLLWRYNQHYFDDLNAQAAPTRRAWQHSLVTRWVSENLPGKGTAWAPYPVSLRLVNWIKWFLAGEPPNAQLLHSMAVQARWLMQRLEWHLLGNHLFINAKALVFVGLFFEGEEAQGWLEQGLRIIEQELPEQFLTDGAQFERSPMYHRLALEDLLDLLNLARALGGERAGSKAMKALNALVPELRRRSSLMLEWLDCMRHPNGALARFNDCAEGIAPETADIERYATALGVGRVLAPTPSTGPQALQPSGYVRAERGAAVLLMDLAPIGPDYLPGHAHADTLSFELSVRGRELIVNRGTSVYGTGPRRQVERGTAAHSTVQLGTHDSSEVWAGFRVGRRARPGPIQIQDWQVQGSHDGYAHLPGQPQHQRTWQLEAAGLQVHDQLIEGNGQAHEAPAVARFHLAPGLTLVPAGPGAWHIADGPLHLAQLAVQGGESKTEDWQHAARFGCLVPASTLAVSLHKGQCSVHISWPE